MTNRINNLLACLVGSFIAAILGLLFLLKFKTPWLAMLTAAIVPALTCRLSGISDRKQLTKITAYAGVGWMLTFMLQPAIAQSSASYARRISALPLLGNDWHIPASVVSALLALIGVYFVPSKLNSAPLDQIEPATSHEKSSVNGG